MDRDAMPVPFFTFMYQSEHGDGINQLLDLNRDGKAELLVSDYDEDPSDAFVGPFCSGHWVHQLLRFNNLEVHEIRGTVGGIPFPLIHNWSYRGTECLEEPKPFSEVKSVVIPKREIKATGAVTRITGAKDDDRYPIEPAAGCRSIHPGIVVYDTSRLRRIAFPNFFGNYADTLVSQMRANRAPMELRGIDHEGNGVCSVDLLWAR